MTFEEEIKAHKMASNDDVVRVSVPKRKMEDIFQCVICLVLPRGHVYQVRSVVLGGIWSKITTSSEASSITSLKLETHYLC